MTEFYFKRCEQVKQDIQGLIQQRANAGLEALGGIENRLLNLKNELKRLEKEISDEEPYFSHSKAIYFFVIVTTKDKVKQNLGSYFTHLNHQRYHQSDCSRWKPFNRTNASIQYMLDDLKKGYPIEIKYLDGELCDEDWIKVDSYIDQSIAIVDLLSLDTTNQITALKFDSRKSKLLLPLCRHLHNDVYDYADNIRKQFKTLSAYGRQKIDAMFFSDVSNHDMFSRHIHTYSIQTFYISK
jgi:hypothetical protein